MSPLIKVLLHDDGRHPESVWAFDLGPEGADGARRVRLDSVPFLHAKPTWGDEILVEPSPDGGLPAWDRRGLPWKRTGEALATDGGRYAMIVDYEPADATEPLATLQALGTAARSRDVVPEGCFGPKPGKPGRLYLAVPKALGVDEVMALLTVASTGRLTCVHPSRDP